MLLCHQTIDDSEMKHSDNVLLNRKIVERKAKHFPYSWWKQVIYTEIVKPKDNDNNVKTLKISYFNIDSDLEMSADTLFVKSCVFYLNKESILISDNEYVNILNITLDFENGETQNNENQILKFKNYEEANTWIEEINKELNLVSNINVECKLCKNISNNHSEICSNCLSNYQIV